MNDREIFVSVYRINDVSVDNAENRTLFLGRPDRNLFAHTCPLLAAETSLRQPMLVALPYPDSADV
jgi:hypothetical protein